MGPRGMVHQRLFSSFLYLVVFEIQPGPGEDCIEDLGGTWRTPGNARCNRNMLRYGRIDIRVRRLNRQPDMDSCRSRSRLFGQGFLPHPFEFYLPARSVCPDNSRIYASSGLLGHKYHIARFRTGEQAGKNLDITPLLDRHRRTDMDRL